METCLCNALDSKPRANKVMKAQATSNKRSFRWVGGSLFGEGEAQRPMQIYTNVIVHKWSKIAKTLTFIFEKIQKIRPDFATSSTPASR
jgi:hypothetical protein